MLKVHRGFTLIELMLVMLIAVLAISVVGLNIQSGNKKPKLDTLANDMASALRYVRGSALIRQAEFCLLIDPEQKQYQIQGEKKIYPIDPAVEVDLTVAENTRLDANIGSFCFFEDGSATGGTIELKLPDYRRLLAINWVTGEISIEN